MILTHDRCVRTVLTSGSSALAPAAGEMHGQLKRSTSMAGGDSKGRTVGGGGRGEGEDYFSRPARRAAGQGARPEVQGAGGAGQRRAARRAHQPGPGMASRSLEPDRQLRGSLVRCRIRRRSPALPTSSATQAAIGGLGAKIGLVVGYYGYAELGRNGAGDLLFP